MQLPICYALEQCPRIHLAIMLKLCPICKPANVTKSMQFKVLVHVRTVYCKSFEVEKFCGFCRLTGDHETFPVKHFPTGKFLKDGC